MKLGLFLALLVLLAATNAFGARIDKESLDRTDPDTKPVDPDVGGRPSSRRRDGSGSRVDSESRDRNDDIPPQRPDGEAAGGPKPTPKTSDIDDIKSRPVTNTKPAKVDKGSSDSEDSSKNQATSVDGKNDKEPVTNTKPAKLDKGSSDSEDSSKNQATSVDDKNDKEPVTNTKPAKLDKGSSDSDDSSKNQATLVDGKDDKEPVTPSTVVPLPDPTPAPVSSVIPPARPPTVDTVHVEGKIYLRRHDSSAIGSVQYELTGTHLTDSIISKMEIGSQWSNEYIARESQVMLYVSTTKTNDRKLAFKEFPIKYIENHFPLAFSVDIDLPDQYRGLLARADITLYFFAYITNPESRIDTFIPYGTSQILLQGTDRLVQKLVVNVGASGIEIAGLFRGRFGTSFIKPGTTFQVQIVAEESLSLIRNRTYEAVSQVTISNVPAMYPVACSLLVPYQVLRPNTRYFAIAFVTEDGDRYLLSQRPVLVINEHRLLVTPQVAFIVTPSPFLLKGIVTRSMPGFFIIQPGSSLLIRLHEIGSNTPDIIYKLTDLVTLPRYFQVNISEATRFDPSKDYNIRAYVIDSNDRPYMATLEAVLIVDEAGKLIVPVDDLLYNIRVRLQPSSGVELHYFKNSRVRVFMTDTPEAPSEPIAIMTFDSIEDTFKEFVISVPTTAILRNHNYYLVMLIESGGIITHVAKLLLISNNQPPPLVVHLPVLSLNLISGVIFDADGHVAKWSSSSFATVYLVTGDREVVQTWKIQLENEFPVRFELHVDFSLLYPDRVYRLQSSIENGRGNVEYSPAGSVLLYKPHNGFYADIRIPVRSIKIYQMVRGLIYINDVHGPLPEKALIRIQLSSSPSLTNPTIVEEITIKAGGLKLPLEFTMNLTLSKININSVYYFLVRYSVGDTVIIPPTQAFAILPRNEVTVVLRLTKTQQILITGQVSATGSSLSLPKGASLRVYITDYVKGSKPTIYGETTMIAAVNSIYEFNIYIDSLVVEKRVPLFLVAEILYQGKIILNMPNPALLQLTPGAEWNIHLVIDLPTLIVGKIVSLGTHEELKGEFDVAIEIVKSGTSHVVHVIRLRLNADLPQDIRIEVPFGLFIEYQKLEARAVIKNCREQILFKSGDSVAIYPGLNVDIQLTVILTDRSKLDEIVSITDETARTGIGKWTISIAAVDNNPKLGLIDTSIGNILIDNRVDKIVTVNQVDKVITTEHQVDKPIPENRVEKVITTEHQVDKPIPENRVEKVTTEHQVDKTNSGSRVEKTTTTERKVEKVVVQNQ